MNWLPIVINLLVAVLVIVSLLIILLVLMQRPKNEGLGAAFGGGMTENLFGAQTTNVLQTITRYLGGIFFALTLLLSWLYVQKSSKVSTMQQKLSAPTVIPATPAATIPAADDKVPLPDAPPSAAQGGKVQVPVTPPALGPDGKLQLPATTPGAAPDGKLQLEVATPPPVPPIGPGAVSDPVKALPATPAPAPTEKPADKPAPPPAVPEKPAN